MQVKSNSIVHIILQSLVEFAPIFLFVICFEISGFYFATRVLVAFTIILTIYIYLKEKRVPYFSLFVAATTVIFGLITLKYHNPHVLQIRDTVYDALLSITLIISTLSNRLILKTLFGHIFKIPDALWRKITWYWAVNFAVLAVMNEYVRHHFHLGAWVYYKMFAMAITIGLGLILLLIYRKDLLE